MQKLMDLKDVREHTENFTVELWRNDEGRLVIRAWNEGHNNYTDVDLSDLCVWLRIGLPASLERLS